MSELFNMSPSDYRSLSARLREIFTPDQRLPEQVFRGSFEAFAVLEFDLMMSSDFGSILSLFVAKGSDTEVYVSVLDPDPENYFFLHFHRYGSFRLMARDLESEYYAALRSEPEGSPADALLYVANVVTIFGNTGNWAIWGERDFGIGLVAFRNHDDLEQLRSTGGITCFDIDTAISDLVALNFPEQVTPPEVAANLRANYDG